MYKLLQNQALSNLQKEINDLGWDAATDKYPEINAHMQAYRGSENFDMSYLPYYTHVADIDANNKEDAFRIHNNPQGDEILEQQITRYSRQHSMSVGDLLVDEKGNIYMCDIFGFEYVGQDHEQPKNMTYTKPAKSILKSIIA